MTVTSTPRYDHPKLKAVAGDVGALAPLLELKYLSLPDTKVAGDVKDLAPLVQLTDLSLGLGRLGAVKRPSRFPM